jgi:hypothetical protein
LANEKGCFGRAPDQRLSLGHRAGRRAVSVFVITFGRQFGGPFPEARATASTASIWSTVSLNLYARCP